MSRELALRVSSAVVLGAVVLGTLILGGPLFALVWLAAGGLFCAEWLTISRTEPTGPLAVAAGLALLALVAAVLTGASAWTLAGLGGLGLLVMLGLARGAAGRLKAALGLVAGLVVVLVPPGLREDPAIGILGPAWMFAVVWSTDIAAYFTGRALGGPKLMPRASPNKTWSGALGGLVAAILAGLAVALVARGQGAAVLPGLSLAAIALLSGLASIVSQAGDLLESALKRRYGVKDSGRTIPGHGGVMDRLDGFFAVAVLVGLALIARKALA